MFDEFIKQVEDAFGNPDWTQTMGTILHNLCMISGMSANEYAMQFEILARCSGFNDEALEDTYACGIQLVIFNNIHMQLALLADL